jgi:hypothetical protein
METEAGRRREKHWPPIQQARIPVYPGIDRMYP